MWDKTIIGKFEGLPYEKKRKLIEAQAEILRDEGFKAIVLDTDNNPQLGFEDDRLPPKIRIANSFYEALQKMGDSL